VTKVIDVHAHVLSESTMTRMQKEAPDMAPRLSGLKDGFATLEMGGRQRGNFDAGAWDTAVRLKAMDKHGIDHQLLSAVPFVLIYDADPGLARAFAAIQNEDIAAQVRSAPDRFSGLANLALQDPEWSAQELRRSVRELGLRGAQIGSHVNADNLDDPALEPVWAAAEELGALIFIHPNRPVGSARMKSYYLGNLIGNPLETTIAAASLVFGGVFQRYPDLKVLLSHGGGFTPYQAGRFIHGWHEREEGKVSLKVSPEEDLKKFYYDTLTHSPHTLRSLIEWSGADHVMFGTDYPFDMGEMDGAERVRELKLAARDEKLILGDNAASLVGLNDMA
jgi:aminocarboxymuconate-semialdehyde decarboxylase